MSKLKLIYFSISFHHHKSLLFHVSHRATDIYHLSGQKPTWFPGSLLLLRLDTNNVFNSVDWPAAQKGLQCQLEATGQERCTYTYRWLLFSKKGFWTSSASSCCSSSFFGFLSCFSSLPMTPNFFSRILTAMKQAKNNNDLCVVCYS